jgi:maltooligosyltrehalose trehalohydrolase
VEFTKITSRGVELRVWAPDRRTATVVVDGSDITLERDDRGWFSGLVANAKAGTRYRYRLDGERETYPDPASKYQPDGPHGDSVIFDASSYSWRDAEWRGPDKDDLVIYEMHVGTFTPAGTWRAAMQHFRSLRETGITMIEMMPVHEFPGRFGWGYDGVGLFAPSHLYGDPDDLRAFVDAAHAAGLAVILDVVYNHFGPDGCYLTKFAKDYFSDRNENDWGAAVNFDGDGCEGVRELVASNAEYWIREFHFDGLRLDATQSIFDSSREHIIKVIAGRVRAAGGDRATFVVAENEPQDSRLVTEYGLDAMWNDDWHHAARVAATGRREAYYCDYHGSAQEFVSMVKHGFLFQGQLYTWQKNPRGSPALGLRPQQLVCYIQNHDQVANSATSERLQKLTSPGRCRALTALLLLAPTIPMLFQGQEFGASTPFLYFADHHGDLAEAVAKGRREFMEQFASIRSSRMELARPDDPATFEASKLRDDEREGNRQAIDFHRGLLALRREEKRAILDGAVLSDHAFVLRFTNDQLLVVNLGPELRMDVMPEPLLAPPANARWTVKWTSEPVHFDPATLWVVPGEVALLLAAAPRLPAVARGRR